jgi:hypothetical protein
LPGGEPATCRSQVASRLSACGPGIAAASEFVGCAVCSSCALLQPPITETNAVQVVLFGVYDRAFSSCLAAKRRSLNPVMAGHFTPRCAPACARAQWHECVCHQEPGVRREGAAIQVGGHAACLRQCGGGHRGADRHPLRAGRRPWRCRRLCRVRRNQAPASGAASVNGIRLGVYASWRKVSRPSARGRQSSVG